MSFSPWIARGEMPMVSFFFTFLLMDHQSVYSCSLSSSSHELIVLLLMVHGWCQIFSFMWLLMFLWWHWSLCLDKLLRHLSSRSLQLVSLSSCVLFLSCVFLCFVFVFVSCAFLFCVLLRMLAWVETLRLGAFWSSILVVSYTPCGIAPCLSYSYLSFFYFTDSSGVSHTPANLFNLIIDMSGFDIQLVECFDILHTRLFLFQVLRLLK